MGLPFEFPLGYFLTVLRLFKAFREAVKVIPMFRFWPWKSKIFAVVLLVLLLGYALWVGGNIDPGHRGTVK